MEQGEIPLVVADPAPVLPRVRVGRAGMGLLEEATKEVAIGQGSLCVLQNPRDPVLLDGALTPHQQRIPLVLTGM